MPIVFEASCRPWPTAIVNAENDWARRNPRLRVPGWPLRKIHRTAVITMYPRMKPTIGDRNIGRITLLVMPCHNTCVSLDASAAPMRPPISACDDDDGRPKYQVIRFQVMAPNSPAKTTPRPLTSAGGVMMPVPTVAATLPASPNSGREPMRLPTAAMTNANRGVSARVDTLVAIAFAASWKPLV